MPAFDLAFSNPDIMGLCVALAFLAMSTFAPIAITFSPTGVRLPSLLYISFKSFASSLVKYGIRYFPFCQSGNNYPDTEQIRERGRYVNTWTLLFIN